MFPPSHGDKFQYNLIDVKGNWGYNNEKYIKTDLITRQSLVNIMRDRITFLINQYQILDLQKKEQLKLDFPQECAPIQKLIEIGNEINLKEQVLKKTETKLNVQEQDLKKTEDLLNLKGQKLALKGQNLNDLISKQEKIIKEMEKDLELKEKEKKNLNISGIYKVIKDNPMKTVLIGGAVIITGVACYYMYIERDKYLTINQ
jgi:DNA helicase HerA-like ATPase